MTGFAVNPVLEPGASFGTDDLNVKMLISIPKNFPKFSKWHPLWNQRNTRFLAACLAFLFLSCSTLPDQSQDPDYGSTLCLPAFPDKDGWYGGDGAWSVDLGDGRVLWLFGDSFVSNREGRLNRVGMRVILGTTLALSTCTAEGEFRIRYRLKKKEGEFVSFFGEGEWLWPQDPYMAGGNLYVPLVSIEGDPDLPGPFGFRILGHRVARIKYFDGKDPFEWSVDYIDLSPGIPAGVHAFATTSVVHEEYVYFFPLYGATVDDFTVFGNLLARISLDSIDDPGRSVEYLTRDGRWQKNPGHSEMQVVLDAAVPEMSVRYHPHRGQWVAVYLSTESRGDRMLLRTADRLEGPWGEPEVIIAQIPEVDPESPLYDKENFCYAGKEHRQFSRGKTLVVTYVCNSHGDPEDNSGFLRNNLFLYRPVV
ncbi:MAG: DUF4185 domain-containing protein, partial [Syntrophales bacterium]|nr:DUF4185 domain-containing protein [Syntrophales bacterium]